MKLTKKYIVFIVVLYMFVFEFALMKTFSVFQYWDEAYAMLCVFFLILRFNGKIKIKKSYENKLFVALTLYILIGLLSNLLFHYQGMRGVVQDVILNVKFFMGIVTTIYLFKDFDFKYYNQKIKRHAKIIMVILFSLLFINKIVGIFPVANVRFGMNSEVLFYNHPTELASVSFFLILFYLLFDASSKTDFIFVSMAILTVLSTLRFKAIGCVMCFLYMYFIVIVQQRKFTLKALIPIIPAILLVAWDEVFFYFFSPMKMEYARGALLYTSVRIAKDFFPIGTGLGTFGSAPSAFYYSIIYNKYGIDTVYGLGKDYPAFISDSFWPMILGQTGILGILLYILIIVFLIKMISRLYKIDKKIYLAGMSSIVYLLVSSTSESAFVNPMSLPLAMIIGIALCRENQCMINNKGEKNT